MRSSNLPALRQLRHASSRLFSAESTLHRTLQQPSLSSPASQCASVSTSTARTPSSSTTRKFVPRSSAKPFTPTSPKAAPAPRQRDSPSIMTVDDVDPSLGPLPSVPIPDKSKTQLQPTPSRNFSETLQSPGYTNTDANDTSIDWSSSFHGLSTIAFEPHVASILMAPIDPEDIEIKPDGIAYLPEIKYRRILNQAFGPGGWGLAPRGELSVGEKVVTREYALVVGGRFVAQARGECGYFSDDTIPTAAEGCKSNALSRCCKDLGIASELWDPRYLRTFKKKHCHELWVEHVVNKKKRQIWTRKDADPTYPYVAANKSTAVKKPGGIRDADGFVRFAQG